VRTTFPVRVCVDSVEDPDLDKAVVKLASAAAPEIFQCRRDYKEPAFSHIAVGDPMEGLVPSLLCWSREAARMGAAVAAGNHGSIRRSFCDPQHSVTDATKQIWSKHYRSCNCC